MLCMYGTGCDKNRYVVDATVNPGDVYDSLAFDGLYDRLTDKNPEIKAIVADVGYKTSWISKRILDDGRITICSFLSFSRQFKNFNLKSRLNFRAIRQTEAVVYIKRLPFKLLYLLFFT